MQETMLTASSLAYLFSDQLAGSVPGFNRLWRYRWWNKESLALYAAIVSLSQGQRVKLDISKKKILPVKYVTIQSCSSEWNSDGLEPRILQALSNNRETGVGQLNWLILPHDKLNYRGFVREVVEGELFNNGLLVREVYPRPVLGPKIRVRPDETGKKDLVSQVPRVRVSLDEFAKRQPELSHRLAGDIAKSLGGPVAAGLFE